MAITNGRYLPGATLLQYIQGTRTDPNNPMNFNQGTTGTPDDNLLTDIIVQAEAQFDMLTGTGYDQQTYTNVQPIMNFVDSNGWFHFFARERGPVSAVSAIQVLDVWGGATVWQNLTWDATNGILLPNFNPATDTYPRPESWHVLLNPSPAQSPRATGQLYAKISYTGGFSVIPLSLQILIARMALWIYKTREIPALKVFNQQFGSVMLPANFPPDILTAINLWRPVYA